MSNARLKLTFVKGEMGTPVQYMIRVTADTAVTNPGSLETPLVVQKGSSSTEEKVARIGTKSEIYGQTLDLLPPAVDQFTSPSLSTFSPSAGQILKVLETPYVWQKYYGMGTSAVFTIGSVVSSTTLQVPGLPAFARNVKYAIYDSTGTTVLFPTTGDYPEDGVANRDYTGIPDTFFRAADLAYIQGEDVSAARLEQASFESGAQALVDAVNAEEYAGTDEEIFE